MTRRDFYRFLKAGMIQGDFKPFLIATGDFLYGVSPAVILRVPAGELIPTPAAPPVYIPPEYLSKNSRIVSITNGAAVVQVGVQTAFLNLQRSTLPELRNIEAVMDKALALAEVESITLERVAHTPLADSLAAAVYRHVEQGWDVYIDQEVADALTRLGLAPLSHGPLRAHSVLFTNDAVTELALVSPLNLSETRITETGRSTLVPAIWLEPISPQVILSGGLPALAPKPILQYRPGLSVDEILGLDLSGVEKAMIDPVEHWVHQIVSTWPDGSTRAIDIEGPPKLVGCLRLFGITEERILTVLHGYAEKAARERYEKLRPLAISPRSDTPLTTVISRHADLEQLREDFSFPNDPDLRAALHSQLHHLIPEAVHGDTPQERAPRNPSTDDRPHQGRSRPVPRPSRG